MCVCVCVCVHAHACVCVCVCVCACVWTIGAVLSRMVSTGRSIGVSSLVTLSGFASLKKETVVLHS